MKKITFVNIILILSYMKKSTVIILWGLITSIAMSLFSLGMYLAGNFDKAMQYVGFLIMFGGLVMGMLQFRNKVNGGFGSFGDLYKIGMLMTVVIAVVSTVYFMVFLQLTPGYMDKIREQAQANMVNQGLSAEQIQMSMKMMSAFTSPIAMGIFGLLGNLFFGAILGLLAAAITAKKKPFMEEGNNTLPQ